MIILSIETSCDETCITIMECKGGINNASFRVLADTVASQIDVHIPYGGVYPSLAKREHIKNLPIVLEKTLKQAARNSASAGSRKILQNFRSFSRRRSTKDPAKANPASPVDLIAVTYGPGLEPALWTGIVFAQELAKRWGVPLIPVNHMEGHLLSVFGKSKGGFKIPKIKTPTLALLVSGGHTELVLMKKWMDYKIIGETLDDAVGEAFDKVARMLGLPYPGGPEISRLANELRNSRERGLVSATARARGIFQQKNIRAESARVSQFNLPRPMLHSKNFNFSFSGLKTAVLYLIRNLGKLNKKTRNAIALEFENAAIECLTHKTAKAIEKYNVKTLLVGGGVAANAHLRKELRKIAKDKKVELLFPAPKLSTDNSLMIGIAGYLNFIKNKKKVSSPKTIKAVGNLRL